MLLALPRPELSRIADRQPREDLAHGPDGTVDRNLRVLPAEDRPLG